MACFCHKYKQVLLFYQNLDALLLYFDQLWVVVEVNKQVVDIEEESEYFDLGSLVSNNYVVDFVWVASVVDCDIAVDVDSESFVGFVLNKTYNIK